MFVKRIATDVVLQQHSRTSMRLLSNNFWRLVLFIAMEYIASQWVTHAPLMDRHVVGFVIVSLCIAGLIRIVP
jgi:hypothetical protein